MPWYTRPTLSEADDGALFIHQVGPTRSEFVESVTFLIPAGAMLVVTWGWPPHWANAAELPAPIALGLLCPAILAGLLILRRRQWRPRTGRIDLQGAERQPASGATDRLLWGDIRSVTWHIDSVGLKGSRDKALMLFSGSDFTPDDWSIVRGRIGEALSPRFDLPFDPQPIPRFHWGRVILTSLPAAVLLGGGALLMPYFGPRTLGIAALSCVGGLFQYLFVLALWGHRLSQPRLGNPYRLVRAVPPDPDAPTTRSGPQSPSAITTIMTDPDGTLVISKEAMSIHDKAEVLSPAAIAIFVLFFAALIVFEPQIDRRVAEPNPRSVVFLGTLALWAIVWTAGECRRSYRDFDRGTWRIEPDRVEFANTDGTTQALRAGEVERVLWESWSVRLRGRGIEIRLIPHWITSVAWQPVRDRVGAMLAPRFDLDSLSPPSDAGRRFLRAASPIFLVPLAAAPIAIAVPIEQFDLALLGWFSLTVLANAYLIRVVRRDRADWLWRRPRPEAGQGTTAAPAR